MHVWHWMSSAICLICMMLFAITGITLNHPQWFESEANTLEAVYQLDNELHQQLNQIEAPDTLPEELTRWINQNTDHQFNFKRSEFEWSSYEIYIQQPFAGGDRWMSIDMDTGEVLYSNSDRGVVAWLNDLHKGRNTSTVWIVFIDIFAIATLVFCVTGLFLLQIHSKRRPSTWYITAAGLLIPAILFFIYG